MTLREVMHLGLTTVRRCSWAFENDYLELEQLNTSGRAAVYAPWATLVSPVSGTLFGASYERHTVLILGDTADDWVEYEHQPQS